MFFKTSYFNTMFFKNFLECQNLIPFDPKLSSLVQFDPTYQKDPNLQHFWLKDVK